jgi:hypothetical protein
MKRVKSSGVRDGSRIYERPRIHIADSDKNVAECDSALEEYIVSFFRGGMKEGRSCIPEHRLHFASNTGCRCAGMQVEAPGRAGNSMTGAGFRHMAPASHAALCVFDFHNNDPARRLGGG